MDCVVPHAINTAAAPWALCTRSYPVLRQMLRSRPGLREIVTSAQGGTVGQKVVCAKTKPSKDLEPQPIKRWYSHSRDP
jgi:hypothetical protein